MHKKKKKAPKGRIPIPKQTEQTFKDKRKKRDKQWRKRIHPDEIE